MNLVEREKQLAHEAGVLLTLSLHYREEAAKSLEMAEEIEQLAHLAESGADLGEDAFRTLLGKKLEALEKIAGRNLQGFKGSFEAR